MISLFFFSRSALDNASRPSKKGNQITCYYVQYIDKDYVNATVQIIASHLKNASIILTLITARFDLEAF